MIRRLIALVAVVSLATGAAAAPKRAAHKPTAQPARAAAPAQISTAKAFDTGDPAAWSRLLGALGAKTQPGPKQADSLLLAVSSTAANFSVQFAQCSPEGRACKAALFDTMVGGGPSLPQINGFNQASAMCRGYQDKSGKPHVTMSVLLYPDETEGHAATSLAAWQGCVAEFASFAKDPVAYLAAAP